MAQRTASEEWASQPDAAELIGCSVRTVERAVCSGFIASRLHHGGRPGVNRASAELFAVAWEERQHRRVEAAAARAAAWAARDATGPVLGGDDPPITGEVWLDTGTVAALLGYSPISVARLAFAGRIPATRGAGRRWWGRRRDVEVYAAARVFMRQQASARAAEPSVGQPAAGQDLRVA